MREIAGWELSLRVRKASSRTRAGSGVAQQLGLVSHSKLSLDSMKPELGFCGGIHRGYIGTVGVMSLGYTVVSLLQ